MGILTQESCPVGNSSRITVSMWCRVPDLSGTVTLLEFGEYSASSDFYSSTIQVSNATDGSPSLLASFNGPSRSISPGEILTGDWQHSLGAPFNEAYSFVPDGGEDPVFIPEGGYYPITQQGAEWYANMHAQAWSYDPGFFTDRGQAAAAIGMIASGKWFHVMVAFDSSHVSSDITFDGGVSNATSWNKAALFINGVNQSANYAWTFVPADVPAVFETAWSPSDKSWANVNASLSILDEFGTSAFSVSSSAGFEATGLTWGASGQQVPAFSFATAGLPVSLPMRNFIGNPAVDYGPVFIYMGQYIDPVAHIGRFVSGNKPAETSAATSAFGNPSYLFKGNKTNFIINRGTAGPCVMTGTVDDYEFGPEF